MADPNLTTRAAVLPNGHGRTIPVAMLAEAAAIIATTTYASINMGACFGAMTMTLDVALPSGTTPTLDVIIEHSHDGSTWATLLTFTQVTTVAATETKTAGPCRQYIRAKATIAGTLPIYTFTVTGDLDASFI
jgi:hypothetical protein